MAWNVLAAWVVDNLFGYQSANKIRENLITLASARFTYHLGGSRQTTLPQVASAQDALDYVDIELDSTQLGGLTVQARVECRTANGATSITPKIRNITDGTDAAVGAACTATAADYSGTNQKQTLALTLAAGVKKYRLQGTPGNVDNQTFVIGHLEVFTTA